MRVVGVTGDSLEAVCDGFKVHVVGGPNVHCPWWQLEGDLDGRHLYVSELFEEIRD
jgi:hypothetical protein